MRLRSMLAGGMSLVLVLGLVEAEPSRKENLRAVMAPAGRLGPDWLRYWKRNGYNAVALEISDEKQAHSDRSAAERIRAAGFFLYYWIEIGRNPKLADEHPEWMASLQGHPEWRRYFPNLRATGEGEVVKNYPWVPVMYRGAFDAHLKRVRLLLQDLPVPEGILLNDLQGGPSACGCGNILCRWTADYGAVVTATRLPDDAAARFVSSVRDLCPGARVIPVWTTECEQADREQFCAGVGCFAGLCWKEFTAQLMPLAARAEQVGVLLTYRRLGRDLDRYRSIGGWVREAVRSFQEMPRTRGGQGILPDRLIAVLEGWDTTAEEQRAQIKRCSEAGAGGFVMAMTEIDQGWEPRIVRRHSSHR